MAEAEDCCTRHVLLLCTPLFSLCHLYFRERKVLMALMEYYCMPADFNVSILEEDELYDDHAQLWDELSEMLGGEASQFIFYVLP